MMCSPGLQGDARVVASMSTGKPIASAMVTWQGVHQKVHRAGRTQEAYQGHRLVPVWVLLGILGQRGKHAPQHWGHIEEERQFVDMGRLSGQCN